MNQTAGAAATGTLPGWLTAILLTLAALGGLAVFGRSIWEFIFRARFRVTFDNETTRSPATFGSQQLSIRIKNRTLGPTASESIFIFFPETFNVTQWGSGGVFVPAIYTPKVMAGLQAGSRYVTIGSPGTPIYFNRNAVLQVDLTFVVPPGVGGDYPMGVSIWMGRDLSRNFELTLLVKAA